MKSPFHSSFAGVGVERRAGRRSCWSARRFHSSFGWSGSWSNKSNWGRKMNVETQSKTEQLNQLLNDKNVVALTSREYLEPVTGKGTTIQPATYADKGYLISAGVAVIDSVQSQANRLEGIFTQPPYSRLVPQVTVEQTDGIKNLLEIGHRLADAVVRYSDANPTVHTAFANARAGDFTALAKLNPTALILGVWDSRDTRVKVPRAFSSQIDAFGIRGIRDRAAQFVSSATEATKAIAGVTDDEEASTKESIDITHEDALEFAQEAAAAFGVGENKTFTLNESTYQAAQKVLDGKAEKSGKKGKK